MLSIDDLFSPRSELARQLINQHDSLWKMIEALPTTVQALLSNQRRVEGVVMEGAHIYDGPVFIGKGSVVEPGAYIAGPAYIGPNVTIRHGALVRGNCIFLDGALLGHASEAKSSLFLEGSKAPHFAYVGDSILGADVNLGAGTKISNVKINRIKGESIKVRSESGVEDTGLQKAGAILGDAVQTGCNAVISPGSVVGAQSLIYAGAVVPPGIYDASQIHKLRQVIEVDTRH